MATAGGLFAGSAFVRIGLVDEATKQLQNFSSKFMSNFDFVRQIQDQFQNSLSVVTSALGPIVELGTELDDLMRQVEARTSGTDEEFKKLSNTTIQVAKRFNITAIQVAKLQAILAQVGYSRSDIIRLTEPIALLSKVAGEGIDPLTDGKEAADAVVGTLKAYNLEAAQAEKVSIMLGTASNITKLDLRSLVETLKIAATTGASFKQPLEDVLATLGLLRNLNIDATMASTAYRNMFIFLSDSKRVGKFNEMLKQMKLNTIEVRDEATHSFRPLIDILTDLFNITKQLDDVTRADMLSLLLGTRAIIPSIALGKGRETYDTLREQILNADKSAVNAVASKQEGGLGGTIRRLTNSVYELGYAFFYYMEKPLQVIGTLLTALVDKWTNFFKGSQKIEKTVIAIVMAFYILGALAVTVSTLFSGVILAPFIALVQSLDSVASDLVGKFEDVANYLKSGEWQSAVESAANAFDLAFQLTIAKIKHALLAAMASPLKMTSLPGTGAYQLFDYLKSIEDQDRAAAHELFQSNRARIASEAKRRVGEQKYWEATGEILLPDGTVLQTGMGPAWESRSVPGNFEAAGSLGMPTAANMSGLYKAPETLFQGSEAAYKAILEDQHNRDVLDTLESIEGLQREAVDQLESLNRTFDAGF